MDTQTVLLVILAALTALGLVLFQYRYKSKKRGRLGLVLSFLRFLTWFAAFLLLINPQFSKSEYRVEKASLVVLADNSSSMYDYRKVVEGILGKLTSSDGLLSKFQLQSYTFGLGLNDSDSLSYSEKNTNIAKALATLRDIHTDDNTVVTILTDGNQTYGGDYVFNTGNSKQSIYPIAIGDTTRYEDLKIDQVNANKYAFLKNKYPVEVFLSYEGAGAISETFTIAIDGRSVFSENVKLSETNNATTINALVDAGSVGLKYLRASISSLEGERNTANNQKNLAVEVIDEKTNVAIISDMPHPDIGALKRGIETNEQRSVSIKKPDAADIDDIDLFILYQPNPAFKSIFEYIERKGANSFIIIGTNTDLNYLNNVQKQFRIENGYPEQEVVAVKNGGFSKFDISETNFEEYPPLETKVGAVSFMGEHDALWNMRIKGVNLQSPLMSILTEEESKTVLLFGENIWKWRAHTYRNDQSFQSFDDFMGKLVVYLSGDKSKERLALDFKTVYEGSQEARIRGNYFDETFAFDPNANLELQLRNGGSGSTQAIPMLLKNGFYEADLSNQPAGQYRFTVSVKNTKLSKSGAFRILDFDVEQQFMSTNNKKLRQLADRNGGKLFYPEQVDALIEALTVDERHKPVQTSTKKVVSLIDFRIILGLIVLTLALEWFVRKYNGLI